MSNRRAAVTNFAAIMDPDQPANQMTVNADGSINISLAAGASFSTKPGSLVSAGNGEMNLAVAGAAVGLTPPAGATMAQITVSGANIRYRDDGTDPTAAVGMPVFQASSWLYAGPLSAIKFIAQAGAGTLDVLYYR